MQTDAYQRGARVGAVVVSFHPEMQVLQQLLSTLAPQVEAVYLVDNGSGPDAERQLQEIAAATDVQLVLLGDNRGIAAAHNIGLQRATAAGLEHLALFDQDSVPGPDLVRCLVDAHADLAAAGERVAAVGARWVDERSGRHGEFYRIRGGRIVAAPQQPAPVEVDFLISSGTLLALGAVRAIGGMREDLFIDHVDTEWCLRARTAGWKLYGASAATIVHALGDDRQRVWLGRWREVALHSPDRNYYEVRNTLLLLGTPGIDWNWRLAQWTRLVQILVFYSLLVPPRWVRIGRMVRGLRDGWERRGGKLQDRLTRPARHA